MRSLWRDFDWLLLVLALAAIIIGVAMIYSADGWADSACPGPLPCAARQAVYAVGGLLVLFIAAFMDYRFLRTIGWLSYLGAIGLLAAVLAAGSVAGGSQRWLQLPWLPIQPSELAKLLVVIALAKYMAEHDMRRAPHLLVSLGITAVPFALIYMQPDLGTALSLLLIWLAMAFVAGMRLLHAGFLALAGVLAVPVALSTLLQDYMRQRIVLFLSPVRDPLGAGFNITQALIAIGSGGLLGRGYGSGTQSQLRFLRVRHTDFIFSVLAEELGFVGAMVLFLILVLLILRVIRAATLARDRFGQLVAVGIASIILIQSFVNIAVNMDLIPATGMPLPLVSYGGSSLVTLLLALGLVQSIVMRRPRAFEF